MVLIVASDKFMKNLQGLLPEMFYLFVNGKKANFQITYTGYKL